MCKQLTSSISINILGEEALGGAICTSSHRQRCELSEEAARLLFLDGKPPGFFSTRQLEERDSGFGNSSLYFLDHNNLGLWVSQDLLPFSCRARPYHYTVCAGGTSDHLSDRPQFSAFTSLFKITEKYFCCTFGWYLNSK